jgi:hypothetical protein
MSQFLHARRNVQLMEPKRMPIWIHTRLHAGESFSFGPARAVEEVGGTPSTCLAGITIAATPGERPIVWSGNRTCSPECA